MNINPNAIRILCYGDSNTWGRIPGQQGKRFPLNVRWTGLLQTVLGDGYEVIEEGIGGRTTVIDDDKRFGRNGKTYLQPCLESHKPLDLVIIMLGTNDFKERYHRSAEQIQQGMEELIQVIKNFTINSMEQPAKIILMSPPFVDETVPGVEVNYKGAEAKSRHLGSLYKELTAKYQIAFINLAEFVQPSKADGYHLEPDAHKKIADVLVQKVKTII